MGSTLLISGLVVLAILWSGSLESASVGTLRVLSNSVLEIGSTVLFLATRVMDGSSVIPTAVRAMVAMRAVIRLFLMVVVSKMEELEVLVL